MNNYKFGTNSLPFVFLAIFVILFIYDSAIEQEERVPEVISKTLSLNNNAPSIQTKNIHIVEQGENLSLIFEKYQVSLNNTYKIFRKDQANEIKNLLHDDRLEFLYLDGALQKIIIYKGPLLSYEVNVVPEILIQRIDKKPEFINSFKTGLIESSFYLAK